MRIACVADTQLSQSQIGGCFKISDRLLQRADKIIHLGDGIKSAKKFLSAYPHVSYIKGGHDKNENSCPRELKIKVGGYSLLFLHGDRESRLREILSICQNRVRWWLRLPPYLGDYYSELHLKYSGKFDIVVYGHVHIPKIEKVGKTIFFCPGAIGPENLSFGYPPSFGVIETGKNKLVCSIYKIELKNQKLSKIRHEVS